MSAKTPSLVATILTVMTLLVFTAALMFFLLAALNGYSEREGGAALAAALVCQSAGLVLSAVIAWRLARLFIERFNWNRALAVLASMIAASLLGSGLGVVSFFAAVLVAEGMR
ncbi:MAG: hypothetical protein DPW18_02570 [Chloroflexi bacterium]|nr:hypothetical protein [Chloroflexota bacterium]MDL1942735.1 hypothetical protein [Chloroflexi bacterium CFX2]